jgi:hypothetical protein
MLLANILVIAIGLPILIVLAWISDKKNEESSLD